MKKHLTLAALCLTLIVQNSFANTAIILTSPVIHLVDGKSFGINDIVIGWMLQMRQKVKKIFLGDQVNGKLVGRYTYNGKKYTARDLVAIESQTNDPSYNPVELREILEHVKQDLEGNFAPFISHAQGAKDQMVMLINESCTLRNRHDSLLPKWGEAKEGNELVFFRDQITNFKALDQFCTDLTNFLEDIMRSCPKAWGQFEKKMADLKQNNHAK